MSGQDCPTQDNLQKFLAGEMPASESDAFELHLADCADCRRDLALMFSENAAEKEIFETPKSLTETVKNLPAKDSKANPASFFSFGWLKIAFASALVLFFAFAGFYVLQDRQTPNREDVLRNGAANNNAVRLLAPENDAVIQTGNIEFRWSATRGAKTYTLVVSDEKGDILKEIPTEKTQIETTASALGLAKEKRYFWHVRAKTADGLTSESETRKISAK